MRRFQFGLQTVLEWRDKQAEQEKTVLETLHAKRRRLEAERAELQGEMLASHKECAAAAHTSADDLRHLATFLNAMRTREDRVTENTRRCADNIGEQTTRCLAADRDHQLLVRLRDRQHTAWQYEVNRELEETAAESWQAVHGRPGSKKNP